MTTVLGARSVRARYGISDMTLWRWVHERKLPKPFYEGRFRFWHGDALKRSDKRYGRAPKRGATP